MSVVMMLRRVVSEQMRAAMEVDVGGKSKQKKRRPKQ